MKQALKWVLRTLLVLAVVAAVFVLVYSVRNPTAKPDEVALTALSSDSAVEVTVGEWLSFQPTDQTSRIGFILYPGGAVDPRAYAPVARQIAEAGYPVFIPSMPFNLAVLGVERADKIIEAHPEITAWAIGGHSLGGAMAAQYASDQSDAVDALILWAAFPPQSVDLSQQRIVAGSIYGTRDGLVTKEEIERSRLQLPSTAVFTAIEGGNHAQFGSYGVQRNDLSAEISAAEQHVQVTAATVNLLEALELQQ